jgi:flagellar biogenesis protein FliO
MATQTLHLSADALRLWLHALWQRILRVSQRAPRRLRLCESLPLGERRFVALIECEQARFLVGGTATSLVLLARMGSLMSAGDEFSDVQHLADEETRSERC